MSLRLIFLILYVAQEVRGTFLATLVEVRGSFFSLGKVRDSACILYLIVIFDLRLPPTPDINFLSRTNSTSMPDYRGFLFVVHPKHGLLLLHCTRKKRKPPHWQVPGGHIDEPELATGDLQLAAKMGATRELYEETGLDVRTELDRLEPVTLQDGTNELKERFFFHLRVNDDDFARKGGVLPMDCPDVSLRVRG